MRGYGFGLRIPEGSRFRRAGVHAILGFVLFAAVPAMAAQPLVAVTVIPSSFRLGVNEELPMSATAHYAAIPFPPPVTRRRSSGPSPGAPGATSFARRRIRGSRRRPSPS